MKPRRAGLRIVICPAPMHDLAVASVTRGAALLFMAGVTACGARTGLREPPPEPLDAGVDASVDATIEAGLDASPDALEDASNDVTLDVPLDVPPDVTKSDCVDASTTYIYVVTTDSRLLSFRPSTSRFRNIGRLRCPSPINSSPFSMAVDRKGTAYVVYSHHALYQVSTADASCAATPYVADQLGFGLFGMGFATDLGGPSETLYIAGSSPNGSDSALGSIDPLGFALTRIAEFVPSLDAELTGTGDGRLYGFVREDNGGSRIVQIDKQSAGILDSTPFPAIDVGRGWAFAWWGGQFYLFTAPQPANGSRVTRYDPNTGSIAQVATLDSVIVGAGVSTCAPEKPAP